MGSKIKQQKMNNQKEGEVLSYWTEDKMQNAEPVKLTKQEDIGKLQVGMLWTEDMDPDNELMIFDIDTGKVVLYVDDKIAEYQVESLEDLARTKEDCDLMKAIVEFPIEKVKKALSEHADVTNNAELNDKLVVLQVGKYKGEDVAMVFLREKIIPVYEKAVEANEEFVNIEYESPTQEEFEEAGFKREGDFYVNDTNDPKVNDKIGLM